MLYSFTAHSQRALQRLVQKMIPYLRVPPLFKYFLGDLAYTLGERKITHSWRIAAVAKDQNQLAQTLLNEDHVKNRTISAKRPTVGFVFTGQGAQAPRMGYGLMSWSREYAESMQRPEEL